MSKVYTHVSKLYQGYICITISDYNYELEKQENKFNYYIDIYNTNSDQAIDTLIFDDLRQLINYLQ